MFGRRSSHSIDERRPRRPRRPAQLTHHAGSLAGAELSTNVATAGVLSHGKETFNSTQSQERVEEGENDAAINAASSTMLDAILEIDT